jgi:deoxyribose-phosphate aldolase
MAAFMPQSIARLIDHSLLHPTMTEKQLREGCQLARRLHVASVCIKPYAVPLATELLSGSDVAVCTVIGFPHGSNATVTKVFEAHLACQQGAVELDMVVNVGRVLDRDWPFVESDILAVVEAAHQDGALVKVIFENEFLPSDDLKIELCRICSEVRADFVKTSTGFGFVTRSGGGFATLGATDHDLRLMRAHAAPEVGLKAAGGVRNYEDAMRVVGLGATRIGTSSTATIVEGQPSGHAASHSEAGY